MAEQTAIEEIKPYLKDYDTDVCFAPPTEEVDHRNRLLLTFTKDIAIYHLLATYAPAKLGGMNNLRKDRYERAIKYFKNVFDGLTMNLPPKPNHTPNTGKTAFSSNPKRINHY